MSDDAHLLLHLLAALVVGYLLGSIPFGFIFTRMAGLGDIRKVGSGNIGATNVLRTGRKGLAAATLVGDALKGTAAVLDRRAISPRSRRRGGAGRVSRPSVSGLAQFKGGKGVATFLGCCWACSRLRAWPLRSSGSRSPSHPLFVAVGVGGERGVAHRPVASR